MAFHITLDFELPECKNLSEAYETGMEIINMVRAWYDAEGELQSFYEIVAPRAELPTNKKTEQTWEEEWGEDAQYYYNEEAE